MQRPLSPAPASARLDSVDLLRGLVMVVMALDHSRDFFHGGTLQGVDPVDLSATTPALFFTRWITHYCAPTFSFLAGAGVWLSQSRGKSKSDLSQFLLTRGCWLIFLDLTLLNWLGWQFTFDIRATYVSTLCALGVGMISLAGLIHLPARASLLIGVGLIAGHNAFDGIKPEALGSFGPLWQFLHAGGWVEVTSSIKLLAQYPLLPWIGIMTAGYAFGGVLTQEPALRRRRVFQLGLGITAAFLAIRALNIYGDPDPWQPQGSALFSAMSFLNCEKYPPSLSFVLMTLGPSLLLLAAADGRTPAWTGPLQTLGKVPMFFYLLHIPLLHAMAVAVEYARFGRADWLFFHADQPPTPEFAGFGLGVAYLAWIAAVVLLYPLCQRFAAFKQRRKDLTWLSYF